jgi:hypothetical protein
MPDTDYRNSVEKEFGHVYKEVSKISETLGKVLETVSEIKTQTTLTNSRVNHLEESSDEREQVVLDFRKLEEHYDDTVKCVRSIDKELEEYRMVKKYPKIFIGLIVVTVIISLLGYINVRVKMKSVDTTIELVNDKIDLINVPMRTRGGGIVLMPAGVAIDSINKTKK